MIINNDRIILDLFISEGEYIVLEDCCCYYLVDENDRYLTKIGFDCYQNELISIKFSKYQIIDKNFYMILYKDKQRFMFTFYEFVYYEESQVLNNRYFLLAFINNILPNLKKLSPEELMIKDLIT
jgi:hypothetical protein